MAESTTGHVHLLPVLALGEGSLSQNILIHYWLPCCSPKTTSDECDSAGVEPNTHTAANSSLSLLADFSSCPLLLCATHTLSQRTMGSRYDTRTTTFSPEGQLFQVSYAMRAISQGASAVGILAADGVVLAAEKRFDSKLLDVRSKTEKLFKIDNHIAVAIAGIACYVIWLPGSIVDVVC
jgi:hypothetical protein